MRALEWLLIHYDWCVDKRKFQTQTYREGKHCEEKKTWGECYEMVFEAEMGIRPPQAENHLGPPEARRGRGEFFP